MATTTKETQDYRVIDNDIRNGNLKNCYLLYGDEIYLKSQYKKKLLKAFGAEGDDNAMNMATFSGKGINTDELISLAGTMPFFADYRTILITDSGFFKEANDKLADFFKNELPDTTRFLFVENEVDKRSRMYKSIKDKGTAIEMTRQDETLLRKWVQKLLASENLSISPATLALFLQKTGNDMSNIHTELEKLICYCMGKHEITAEDVDAIVTVQLQDRVFIMIEAMNNKNHKLALHLYYELLSLKISAYKILSIITGNFSNMLIAKELRQKGNNSTGIAERMGFGARASWRADKLLSSSSSYTLKDLENALSECAEYDEMIKTGRITDQLAVEMLIVKYSTRK